MVDGMKRKEFERDESGTLICDNLAGQDFKACQELKKKEMLDDLPRKDDGSLDCDQVSGDEKVVCRRQKASEVARKSIGMKTEGD